MIAVVVAALALLAFQPAQQITIEDCLLRSGYSRAVTPTPLTQLAGAPALEWETVLAQGQRVGYTHAQTDTEWRVIMLYVWNGSVYVFVGKSESDPGVRLPGEARSVVHGDCLLRIGG